MPNSLTHILYRKKIRGHIITLRKKISLLIDDGEENQLTALNESLHRAHSWSPISSHERVGPIEVEAGATAAAAAGAAEVAEVVETAGLVETAVAEARAGVRTTERVEGRAATQAAVLSAACW